jgi:hypothetical protein
MIYKITWVIDDESKYAPNRTMYAREEDIKTIDNDANDRCSVHFKATSTSLLYSKIQDRIDWVTKIESV